MTPLAERLRLNVDFARPVGRLAVGDQQKVEILKQLLAGARVLILDEPSKVLAPQEAERLFRSPVGTERRRLRIGLDHPQASRGDGLRQSYRGDAERSDRRRNAGRGRHRTGIARSHVRRTLAARPAGPERNDETAFGRGPHARRDLDRAERRRRGVARTLAAPGRRRDSRRCRRLRQWPAGTRRSRARPRSSDPGVKTPLGRSGDRLVGCSVRESGVASIPTIRRRWRSSPA